MVGVPTAEDGRAASAVAPAPAPAAGSVAHAQQDQVGFGDVLGVGARRIGRWWRGEFSGL